MKQHRVFFFGIALVWVTAAAWLVALLGRNPQPVHAGTRENASSHWELTAPSQDLIRQHPDEFSWRVLAAISAPVTRENPQGAPENCFGKPGEENNYALWETWADNDDLFPAHPDPNRPPLWADRKCDKRLKQDPLQPSGAKPAAASPIPGVPTGDEEIRHNQADFQLIVDTKMWYREGLAHVFQKQSDGSYTAKIDADYVPELVDAHGERHPEDAYAIEIKAKWVFLCDDASKGCKTDGWHWSTRDEANGKRSVWGLVALHIMTRGLHTWTWSTFENINNPIGGQCGYYGCEDSFGCGDPAVGICSAHIASHDHDAHNQYPTLNAPLSSEVKGILTKYGEWNEWKNYRLRGTQVDYLDAEGKLTRLGNSVLETSVNNIQQTSSCISCHARARVRMGKDGLPAVACDCGFTEGAPNCAGTRGPVGLPYMEGAADANHYSAQTKVDANGYAPVGFLWSVMHARSVHGGADSCTAGK